MYDYSTLDMEAVARLHKWDVRGYRLGDLGAGCFLDPPGYPTYFLRHVFNNSGDSPRYGAQTVLDIPGQGYRTIDFIGVDNHDVDPVTGDLQTGATRDARLMALYKPLPLDHQRVRLWIWECFRHLNSCYLHPTRKNPHGEADFFIWFGTQATGKLARYDDDYPRLNHLVRDGMTIEQVKRADASNNVAIAAANDALRPHVTFDNHLAVVRIRRFYPDFPVTPEWISLIVNPPKVTAPQWWERHACQEDVYDE